MRRKTKRAEKRKLQMDMSEFLGSRFLRLEDCRESQQHTISDCVRGNYGRPDLIFDSGYAVSLNQTSLKALIQAYGGDSSKWPGLVVETSVGQVDFKDGKTDAVLVMPVSPPTSDGRLPPPKPKATNGGDLEY